MTSDRLHTALHDAEVPHWTPRNATQAASWMSTAMDGLPRVIWRLILSAIIAAGGTAAMYLVFGVAVPALTR